MSKHILVISTSLRKDSNSSILADAFCEGAVSAGNTVEKISLDNKTINFCRGCLACQKSNGCIIQDDMSQIVEQMMAAEVIVFATPIYFYEMCGQMKTLLDRSNPIFPMEYNFRDIYLLATAADGADSSMDIAVRGLEGWIGCFKKARLAGVVRATSVDDAGKITEHVDILKTAYTMGENA